MSRVTATLLTTVCVSCCFLSRSAAGQEFVELATTAEIRSMARAVLDADLGPEISARSSRFLKLTGPMIWTYNDRGEVRVREEIFSEVVLRNEKPCVMFASKSFVPIELLGDDLRRAVREIQELSSRIVADYASVRRLMLERRAVDVDLARQAEIERTLIERRKVPRVQLLADTDVTVVENGRRVFVTLRRGETYDKLSHSATEVEIAVGGVPVRVPRRAVVDAEPKIVLKPTVRDVVVDRPAIVVEKPVVVDRPRVIDEKPVLVDRPAVIPPVPALDAELDIALENGRQWIYVRGMAENGVAQLSGLHQDDIITRVNDIEVHSIAEFRAAARKVEGAMKLQVVDPKTRDARVVEISSGVPTPVALGIAGHADRLGQFLIDEVVAGSISDRLGLQRDDVLLSINGRMIQTRADLRDAEVESAGKFKIRALISGAVKTFSYPQR